MTTAVSPGKTPASLTPLTTVDSGSARAATCAGTSAEIGKHDRAGTTTLGARPPSTKMPCVEKLSQWLTRPRRHQTHWPHEPFAATTTRSPGARRVFAYAELRTTATN